MSALDTPGEVLAILCIGVAFFTAITVGFMDMVTPECRASWSERWKRCRERCRALRSANRHSE